MTDFLETKTSIVAFIDLLGTSEAIKNDQCGANLNAINSILQAAIDMCSDKHICEAEVKVKSFSDNIVFAMDFTDDLDSEEKIQRIYNILEICAYFQIAAFQLGISTRGGITIGDFFCNDKFVWGNALLRTYELESKIAIYPRIIVDSNIMPFISKLAIQKNNRYVQTDFDGLIFLDYLSFFEKATRTEYIKRTINDAKRIITTLTNNERAIQKIKWIISYFERELSNKQG